MSVGEETYTALKQNREKGVKLLYEVYSKKLFAYSTYNWKTKEDETWDLIYKTMYRTADVIHRYEFENEQKFASFIFRIFINYLRNHVRDTALAAQGTIGIPLNETIINTYIKPETTSSLPDPSLQILQQELDKLEDWQRILMLMRSQNIPYKEIAAFAGKPEKQLKVYYGRIKKLLADRIQDQLIKTKENV